MKKSDTEFLSKMRARFRIGMDACSDSRQLQLLDMKFAAGNSDNNWQWPENILNDRDGKTVNPRPCLTINKLTQHIKQITNDQRQNRPAGRVIPVDDKGDIEVAEILNGLVKHIEYISNADVAYDTACEHQVTHGEGYFRLVTEYCEDDSSDQDLKILRVRNPFSVTMDPMAQDPCGEDAEWSIISDILSREEYHRTWPDAMPVSGIESSGINDSDLNWWVTDQTIRIAEYYYAHYEPFTLNTYPNKQSVRAGSPEDEQLMAVYGKPRKTRASQKRTIKWVKTNGFEILEETDWVGRHIPVIRVIGNEVEVDGKLHISGLVRNSKDAQRTYNYMTSAEIEMLALAPKAPFIGYSGQFEGYQDQWKVANVKNLPYLEVNAEATDGLGNPLPLPQRQMPPQAQIGFIQAKQAAGEDIKGTTGQYNASIGMGGNERSAKAIIARQKEGDTGTYHYVDNYARAIRYLTRQIIDCAPKIYDTQRVARIIGDDGDVKMVEIDPDQPQAVTKVTDPQNPSIVIKKIYNLGVGKYDAYATTGPGYATKRQEALEAMSQLLQGNPELWKIAGDLFIKNMDWPGAQEMAKRFAKSIDPRLLSDSDENPQLQAAQQQIEQMGQQMQQMEQMIQNIHKSIEAREVAVKEYEAEIKSFDAETKRITATQAGMSLEQIQDIAMGTIDAAIEMGDISPGSPKLEQMEPVMIPEQGFTDSSQQSMMEQ